MILAQRAPILESSRRSVVVEYRHAASASSAEELLGRITGNAKWLWLMRPSRPTNSRQFARFPRARQTAQHSELVVSTEPYRMTCRLGPCHRRFSAYPRTRRTGFQPVHETGEIDILRLESGQVENLSYVPRDGSRIGSCSPRYCRTSFSTIRASMVARCFPSRRAAAVRCFERE
jgi:hypothetical protein